jgi:prepilin-type N-terminal cleavage/methylation domain-containing protein
MTLGVESFPTMQRTRRIHGFTLIELIMVIVITGTLAVVALPRMVDTTMWRLQAYGDQLQNQLRTAQRLAATQRRPVIATITPTGASVAYVSGSSIATLACPSAIPSCIAESGTRTVTFNASNTGQALTSSGTALTITVSGGSYSRAFTVENDTGAVH